MGAPPPQIKPSLALPHLSWANLCKTAKRAAFDFAWKQRLFCLLSSFPVNTTHRPAGLDCEFVLCEGRIVCCHTVSFWWNRSGEGLRSPVGVTTVTWSLERQDRRRSQPDHRPRGSPAAAAAVHDLRLKTEGRQQVLRVKLLILPTSRTPFLDRRQTL